MRRAATGTYRNPAADTAAQNGLIMMQRFQAVGFSAAEETNRVCIRVHLIGIPDDRHKSIDGEAHIGTACDQTEL